MQKYKLVFLMLFISTLGLAQRQTTSLYSRYGYGDLYSGSFAYSQSMGGLGVAISNPTQINFINPANHSDIKSQTFLFQTGIGSTYRKFEVANSSAAQQNIGLEYFAFAFPVIDKKWGSSIGLLPFNSVGYSIQTSDDYVNYSYTGNGGINKIVWGNSFVPFKGFSIGFNASYLFGKTNYTSIDSVPNDIAAYNVKKLLEYKSNGLLWEFGIKYSHQLSELQSISIGATYRDKQTIAYEKSTFFGSYTGTVYEIIKDTLENSTLTGYRTDIPQEISVGIAYKNQDKFQIGFDAGVQNWDKIYVYKKTNALLQNSKYVKAGFEFVPNIRSSQYLKKIPYRFGAHYLQMPIAYSSNGVTYFPKDFGITFGTQLLLKQSNNSLNIAIDAGKRGDSNDANAIIEKYILLKLNISLQENWFFKRKID